MAKAIRNSFDYTTGVSKFTVQNKAFLDLLPRAGIAGKEDLKNHPSAAFGSMAFVIDSNKRYILNSENEWQEITVSSSGGSGGAGDSSDLPNYVEITNDEIVSWFEDDNV